MKEMDSTIGVGFPIITYYFAFHVQDIWSKISEWMIFRTNTLFKMNIVITTCLLFYICRNISSNFFEYMLACFRRTELDNSELMFPTYHLMFSPHMLPHMWLALYTTYKLYERGKGGTNRTWRELYKWPGWQSPLKLRRPTWGSNPRPWD